MPPNFGIKVILFQNYPVCIPDWSTVTGREPWSGVHRSLPLASIHEPMPKTFARVPLFHGHLDSSSWAGYKMLIRPWQEHSLLQPCFSSIRLSECSQLRWTLHGLSLCNKRSWVVRGILVRRVIVSLILAPYRAKESAVAVRRSLVISPASSHQARKAILVFARARVCGHFPLFVPSNAYRENHKLLSSGFLVTKKSARYLLGRQLFCHYFPNGLTWLVSR